MTKVAQKSTTFTLISFSTGHYGEFSFNSNGELLHNGIVISSELRVSSLQRGLVAEFIREDGEKYVINDYVSQIRVL